MKIFFYSIVCVFCLSVVISAPETTFALSQDISAQTDAYGGSSGANFTVTDDPRIVAARVIQIIISLLGFLFFVYIIYGGGLIAFSRGNEEDIKKGKNTIVNGMIGIIIILTAYSVTRFVSNALMRSTGVGDQNGCGAENSGCFYIEEDTEINPDPLAPRPNNGPTIWDTLRGN